MNNSNKEEQERYKIINYFENKYYTNNFVENADYLSPKEKQQKQRFPLADLVFDLKKAKKKKEEKQRRYIDSFYNG